MREPGELIVALQDDGQTLDPHAALDAASMRLVENMYNTLLRYADAYGEVEPDLAERYEVSEDGRRYTFHLRRDVRFRSGRELTAGDVKYSVQRIREHLVRADHFEPVERIDAPDTNTIVFHLREPFAPFLVYLANPMNAIVDHEVVDRHGGSLRNADAGSGPFQLVEWRRGWHLILERNPHYHESGRPHLERIIYRPLPDETSRTIALRRGEVDLVLDVAEKDIAIVQNARHVRVASAAPGTFWEYVGLNTSRPPFDDVRVRQACAWALDRDALNRMVKLGRAVVLTGGPIRPDYWAHHDRPVYPHRDLDRASQLLAEAGLPDGFVTTLKVGSAFPYQVDAAQVVKQQLRQAGIDVRIEALESGVFFDALGRGDFDMTLVGWVGFVDPDEWLYNLFHSQGRFNQQRYASPPVDALLEEGRRTMDRSSRREIYAEAQRLIAEDAPMLFLYLSDQTSAWLRDLSGFSVHPTATTLSLRDTRRIRQADARPGGEPTR